jgi:hypothetical protein
LKHVEIENSKLKDTRRKLRSELGSYEKIVVSLKKQLEYFQKLREETISLENLLEEERIIAEVKNVQMIKKEEYCEKLEQEVLIEEELKKLSSAKRINTSWMHG